MRLFLLAVLIAALVPLPGFAQAGLDKIISFNARDSEIRDIVMSLGRLADVNVIVDPKVRGKLPLQLKNVTAGQAMKLVAGITGNKIGMVDGVVVFGTEETLKFVQGPGRSVNYTLRYAKAEDVANILNKVFPKDISAIQHAPTNKVIITPK